MSKRTQNRTKRPQHRPKRTFEVQKGQNEAIQDKRGGRGTFLALCFSLKKDCTFQKVMEIQKDLKDTDGFDWLESTELAIDKRKFLLNGMFVEEPIPQDED